MRKVTRRIISIVLSLAMVATGIVFSSAKVGAAVTNLDDVNYNLAYQKTVTSNYTFGNEGNLSLLTDASVDTGRVFPNSKENGSYTVDLTKYYTVSSINKIAFYYNEAHAETYPSKEHGLTISYSQDGETFYDVKTVTGIVIDASDLWQEIDMTGTSVSDIQGVRYVKVTYPESYTWGVQLREFAVMNNAGNHTEAEIDMCDNPDSITLSSNDWEQLKYTVVAGPNQEGYVYDVYLNDSTTPVGNHVSAGTQYTVNGLKEGDYSVKVISRYNDLSSSGLVDTVHVKCYDDYISDGDYNYAYGKTFTMYGDTSQEGNGSITNGTIASNDYVSSRWVTAGTWYCIDLEKEWKASSFETVAIWFRGMDGGTHPGANGMKFQYSTDGESWSDVATITKSDFDSQKGSKAPFIIEGDVSSVIGNVRYVRAYFPDSITYGPQVTEFGVFDIDDDAEEASAVTVDDPDNFTAQSNAYNTITGTITAGAGQSGYTYSIFLGNDEVASGLSAGSYTLNNIPSGSYTVKCKSKYQDHYSHGLTVQNVTVEDSFDYTKDTSSGKGVFPDTKGSLYNYVTRNGSTARGVSASASESTAASAIDYNAETRWETSASDPQWITVDLGEVKTVKEIDISWETASSKDYTIQVSSNGTDFTTVATIDAGAGQVQNRRDLVSLKSTVDARYIKINATSRTTGYGHSIWEMAVYGPETPPATYNVTLNDEVVATLESGDTYTLPGVGETGYCVNGYVNDDNQSQVYKPSDEVTVNSNLNFTSLATIDVTSGTTGASIRTTLDNPGISFKATAQIDNGAPINSKAFTYGMMITTEDIFTEYFDYNLTLDSPYADREHMVNVTFGQNDWIDPEQGVFRAGILNVASVNFTREFRARAYLTIKYVDGTTNTFYSAPHSLARSIQGVAANLIAKGALDGDRYTEAEKEAIRTFAEAQ